MKLARTLLVLALPLFAQDPSASSSAPLPSVEGVLQRMEARLATTRTLSEAYGHTERTHMRILDSKGKVIKEETKEFEVTPIHGKSIKRLVKVDGKPLSEKDASKEDARVLQ